jgi:hypothetical protein
MAGGGLPDPGTLSGSLGYGQGSRTGSSHSSQGKVLSQGAFDKIVYDILSGNEGLAALAQGENSSGGFGSSTKGLMAQDLTAKLAGTLAEITAPTITDTNSKEKTKSFSSSIQGAAKVTVICTELVRQGKLSEDLYLAGHEHFTKLSPVTVNGYHAWAMRLIPLMQKSEKLSNFFLPVAKARYEMIVNKKFSLLGAATIYIGQPLCYLIGVFCPSTYRSIKDGRLELTD